jgi:hypothetical protein
VIVVITATVIIRIRKTKTTTAATMAPMIEAITDAPRKSGR